MKSGSELEAVRFIKTPHRCACCRSTILQATSKPKKGEPERTTASRYECANCPERCIGQTPRTICLCGVAGDGCEPGSAAAGRQQYIAYRSTLPEQPGRYWYEPQEYAVRKLFFDVEVIEHRGTLYAVLPVLQGDRVIVHERTLLELARGRFAGPLPLPIDAK